MSFVSAISVDSTNCRTEIFRKKMCLEYVQTSFMSSFLRYIVQHGNYIVIDSVSDLKWTGSVLEDINGLCK